MDALLIYIFVGTFTPGPNNIISSSSSSNIGFKKTIPFMFGVLFGTYIVFFITGLYNGMLFENVSVIQKYIGYIGAVYMTYLAFKIATSDYSDEAKSIGENRLMLKGILLTLINPKAIIFGLTVTGLYINLGVTFQQHFLASLGLAVLCFISVLLWGGFGYLFMKFLSKYRTLFNVTMASLLIFTALLIILDTI